MSKKNSRGKPCYKLLPPDTIQAATQGEPDAVAAVLRHYEGYIAKLSPAACSTSTATPISAWTKPCAAAWKSS